MTYSEQLKDPRWQRKRLEVFNFYDWRCCGCDRDIDQLAKEQRQLHAHHRYYIKGRMAWEYLDTEFLALCDDCHEQVHTSLDEVRKALSALHYVDVALFAEALIKAFEEQNPRTVLLSIRMFLDQPELVAKVYDDLGYKHDWSVHALSKS